MSAERVRPMGVDDDVDIFALVRLTAGRWYLVAAGVGIGLVGALLYVWLATPLYRGSGKLLVGRASMDERRDSAPVTPQFAASYRPFVLNGDVLRQAISDAGLSDPSQQWKIAKLGDRLSVVVSRDAPVLELSLDSPDAAAAEKLLTAICNVAIDFNRRLNSQSELDARELLKVQLDAMRSQLGAAEGKYLEFMRTARGEEERKKEGDLILERIDRMQRRLVTVSERHAGLVSSTATLAKLLSEQQKLISLRRALGEDGAATSAAKGASPASTIVSEMINPVYEQMEPELVKQQSDLQGASAARDLLVKNIQAEQGRARALFTAMQNDQLRAEQLKMDVDLARTQYKTLFERYESTRIALVSAAASLRIFEKPRVSSAPVSPRVLPSFVFGALGGALVGLVAAFLSVLFFTTTPARQPFAAARDERIAV
jgi:uncharacterized protein involved in exopolysaccharide biosynthesis